MSNKIIYFGNETKPTKQNQEIFVDIATTSIPNYKITQDTSAYKIDKNINADAVNVSLYNIFSWITGQRILNPEFGNSLYKHLYNGITEYSMEPVMVEIRYIISTFDNRIKLIQVVDSSTDSDHENNTISLDIIYSIPSLSNVNYIYTHKHTKS